MLSFVRNIISASSIFSFFSFKSPVDNATLIFLPRDNFNVQEDAKTIVEKELTKSNFKIYGWRQVPINTKVLGDKANSNRPEITQILFKHNDKNLVDKDLSTTHVRAEQTGTAGVKVVDFLSNGFKIRGSNTEINQSGNTHIYMAFAEAPFVNSNEVPCTAR